jgi:hypothetical protein
MAAPALARIKPMRLVQVDLLSDIEVSLKYSYAFGGHFEVMVYDRPSRTSLYSIFAVGKTVKLMQTRERDKKFSKNKSSAADRPKERRMLRRCFVFWVPIRRPWRSQRVPTGEPESAART